MSGSIVRVAILDDYQGIARKYGDYGSLENVEISIFGLEDHTVDEDALVERLHSFEVIGCMRERTPFKESLLKRLTNLKLLITTLMTNSSIDVAACEALGIHVAGTDGHFWGTPELTWALIFALARHILEEHENIRKGGWQCTVGKDLKGSTLGIVGLGQIGSTTARVAQAFGMKVIAWSQNLTDEYAKEVGAEKQNSLMDLMKAADIVTIHARLSDRTRNLIGEAELKALGPKGLLVNTARGPIVNERALVKALTDGTIAGAGLDTYDVEPLPPNHPLRSAPNVVTLPHIGYGTEKNYELFHAGTVECIREWTQNRNVVRELTKLSKSH